MQTRMYLKIMLALVFLVSVLCGTVSYRRATPSSEELAAAVSFLKRGLPNESLQAIDAADIEDMDKADLLRAFCHLRADNLKDAAEYFERVAGSDFLLADLAMFKLGDIHKREGRYPEAMEEYERLTKKFTDSMLFEKAKIKIAACFINMEEYDDAILLLGRFIEDLPTSPLLDSARYNMASAFEKKGAARDAWKTYHELSLYHPLSPYSTYAIAGFKRIQEKYKLPYYSAPAEDLFRKGMVFFRKGDFVAASHVFGRVIRSYPYSSVTNDALIKLGQCEYRRRMYSSSIARYREVLKKGGTGADAAHYYMAFSYGRSGNLWKALESLQNVIKFHPSSSFAHMAQYYTGYYYEVNGYTARAMREYEILVDKYPSSSLADDALWRIGKTFYSQKEYKKAFDAFDRVVRDHNFKDHAPKCAFWKAKSAEKMGKRSAAIDAYRYVIKRFDHTYYSYQSREKLESFGASFAENRTLRIVLMPEHEHIYNPYKGASPVLEQTDVGFTPLSLEEQKEAAISASAGEAEFNAALHFSRYDVLIELGLYDVAAEAASFIAYRGNIEDRDSALMAMNAALFAAGNYKDPLWFADGKYMEAIRTGEFGKLDPRIWQMAYPRAYYKHVIEASLEFGVDPYLIFAVIREESRFDPGVVSWAKAHGLMQIIPSTGQSIAKSLGIRPFYNEKMFDPGLNIRMGTYYLSTLIKRFDGNVYLALAAYNGGSANVRRWLARRPAEPDIDEFVEYIPFYETRRYVQKVMKSYNEYKRIYRRS